MKLFFAFLSTLVLLSSAASFAGEGHDHGPGQVQPTKGGVLMKAHNFFLEAVGTTSEIKFHPLKKESAKSNTLKPIALNEVKITATYTIPRGKSNQAVALSPKKDHFSGMISASGAHRYQVDVNVEVGNEKEKFVYQIEPQE